MKPSVLCVGFAKCGTTTLYDILSQHKDIYLSKIKEPIYYENDDLLKRGFKWYEKRYYPKKSSKKIIMEINPAISRDVSASTIKKDFGKDTKIIFLVRHPVKRLYSAVKMNLLDGTDFENPKDNLGDSTRELFRKWIDNSFERKNGKLELKKLRSTKFCPSGDYYPRIKDYINTFGKDKVKVIFFEDFIKNPEAICNDLYKFLNILPDKNINYNIHSNEGNRLPKSVFSMKATSFMLVNIYKRILIKKLPFVSDSFCKIINDITWKSPNLFSKKNLNKEEPDKYSFDIVCEYYYDMMVDLSNLLGIDVFKKWNLEKIK